MIPFIEVADMTGIAQIGILPFQFGKFTDRAKMINFEIAFAACPELMQ